MSDSYKILDLFSGEEREIETYKKKFVRLHLIEKPNTNIDFNTSSPVTNNDNSLRKSDFKSTEEYEEYLTNKSKTSVCKCHHPTFASDICHYRTCRHSRTNHL